MAYQPKKRKADVDITFNEFMVQWGLGTFTKPAHANTFIRATTDEQILRWCVKHQQEVSMQKAAVFNPACPLDALLYAILYLNKKAKISTWQRRYGGGSAGTSPAEMALKQLHKRFTAADLKAFEPFLINYPQLTLPL